LRKLRSKWLALANPVSAASHASCGVRPLAACAALQADTDLLQTLHDPVMHGATHALMEHTGKVIFGQGHDLRQRGQAQGFAVGQMSIT
jgi:pyruvate/oxaloacetate carboxyltransferase